MARDLKEIAGRINQLNLLHRIYLQRAALANDLYWGQLRILEFVDTHDLCTQREVAETMQVSPPSIAMSVKRLQKNGYLEKHADHNDLRYTRLRITEAGRKAAEYCRKEYDRIDAQMFEGVDEEEQEYFCRTLDRMIGNLAVGEFEGKDFCSLVAAERALQAKRDREACKE